MASLDHLLCASTIEKRQRNSLHRACYSKPRNLSPAGPGAKPNSRRCNVPNCQKTAKRGGRCIAHGGGNKCAVDGCTTSVVSRGLCVAHGGGKRCQAPTCAKSAQSGGFCWVHGGGKKCGYHGCPKRAQSGGACIAHGGGKRCRIDGCNKVVQYDGLCVGHGGYRRCIYKSCGKRAMANDHCQQHGGSSVCLLDYCYKRAVRGGMCSEHKAEASFHVGTATGLSTPSHSSDEDQERQVNKPVKPFSPTTEWRGKINAIEPPSTPHSELGTSTSGPVQLHDKASTPSARFALKDQNWSQREDSPVAPGFSALLDADNNSPSFLRMCHQRQEQKTFPLLPSIRFLQNQCTGLPAVKSNLGIPTMSEPRMAVQEDNARLKWESNAGVGCRESGDLHAPSDEPTTRKAFVHSYYYRKNEGGVFPHTASPKPQHSWGPRHIR